MKEAISYNLTSFVLTRLTIRPQQLVRVLIVVVLQKLKSKFLTLLLTETVTVTLWTATKLFPDLCEIIVTCSCILVFLQTFALQKSPSRPSQTGDFILFLAALTQSF